MTDFKAAEQSLLHRLALEEREAVARGACATTPEVDRELTSYSRGNIKALHRALKLGANPNLMVKQSGAMISLLGFALRRGKAEAIEILLAAGAEPGKDPAAECAALTQGIKKDDVRLVRAVLAAGAGLNVSLVLHDVPNSGQLPLSRALSWSAKSVIEEFIKQGVEVNPAKQLNLMPPLHIAAGKGDLEICMMLVNAGAKVECRSRFTAKGSLCEGVAADFARLNGHSAVASWINGFDARAESKVLEASIKKPSSEKLKSGSRRLAL